MSKHQDDGALVVASLRFAAALLPPEVIVNDICTKTALSAIVLASHRVSQQAAAQHKFTPGADPRRLLAKLLESGLDDQLARVAFADITWDSEGVASQTLQMELQDVEERATATLHRSVCVLVSVRGPSSSYEETAVVWFPHRHEDDNNSDSKSHKYLLFVAPGRVKVVKNLSELMKKMQDEMAVLRGRDATYRAWTLFDNVKIKKEPKPMVTIPTKPKYDRAEQGTTPATSDQEERAVHPRKEEIPEQENSSPEEITSSQKSRPQPRALVRAMTEDQAKKKESMFAFSRVALVEPVESRLQQHDKKCMQVASPVNEKDDSSVTINELEPTSPSPIQQIRRRGPLGVSASHASATAMRSGRGESTSKALWQSVDGEIKRTRRAAQDLPSTEEGAKPAETNATLSHLCQVSEENADQDAADASAVRPARIRPFVSHKEATETMFLFSSTRALPSPTREPAPSSSIQTTKERSDLVDQPPIHVKDDDTTKNAEEEETNIAVGVAETAQSPVKKKRSARDHYRSKLGARVWWELEYQATKILQQGVKTENSGDDHCLQTHTPKQITVERRRAMNGRVERPHRASNPVGKVLSNVRETTQQLHSPVVREPKLPLGDPPNEIEGSRKLSSTHTSQINVVESAAPAPTRVAWTERAMLAVSAKEPPENAHWDAVKHTTESTVPNHHVREEEKKVTAAAVVSTAVVSSERHRKSVEAAMARAPEATMALKGASPRKSSKLFETRAQVQADALLHPAAQHLQRKRDPTRRGMLPTATIAPEQSPAYKARKAPGSPLPHPKSERFGARQSHARDEYENEHYDSVLMATMAPRAQSSSPGNVDRSGQLLSEPSEHLQVHDERVAEAPSHRIPFNVHGRVPIRQPQQATRVVQKSRPDGDGSDGDDADDHEMTVHSSSPPDPVVVQPKIHRSPPPMATFISVEPASTKPVRDDDATQRARQQKLTELRQKKLQQLQKARDDALNKKKPGPQPSIQSHPAPATNPHETKSRAQVSAAPPPTSAVDRGDAFPLTTTTTRTGHRPSNRQLIQNAIEYTLLAGGSLDKERQAALHALAESTCENFIVLLKSAKELKFRALYEHHIERGRIVKIYGMASSAPPLLTEDVISQFFRYNSGKKEFASIDGRSFTVKTDACALVDQLVFRKKPLHRLL